MSIVFTIEQFNKEELHKELMSGYCNRPLDTVPLKNFLMENGMEEQHWNNIYASIEDNKKIHNSIIFFMLDPQIALKMIPQRWYDFFPDGFVKFVDDAGKDLTYEGKRDLFRRTAYFELEGPSKIMMADIHINTFLEHIPDFMYDLLLQKPDDIDKIIAYCKDRKQEDSVGYSKLLMLK